MKIYKPKHRICESKNVGMKEIPLSYVDAENNEYLVEVSLSPAFAHTTSTRIEPYQEFTDDNPFLFNKNGKVLTNVPLKRRNDKYAYEPAGMTEFTPQEFSCAVLIKRGMKFRNDKNYDIKIGIAEEGPDLRFSKDLISIFGDANKRGLCPANITVNSGNMIPQSLIANSIKEDDFFIAHSSDGIHIIKNGKEAKLDIDGLLSNYTNIWLSVNNFGDMIRKNKITGLPPIHTLKTCNLYNVDNYVIDNETSYEFDITKRNSDFPETKYSYEFIHPSILVLEKKNEGYIIVTPAALFKNLAQNVHLIYEILMNIYMRSYYKSANETSWITDVPIDYIAGQTKKANIRHKRISLDRMLEDSHADKEYSIVSILTDRTNVQFSGMTQDHELLFFKSDIRTDPVKKEGEVSYYTSRHTVMHYSQQDIYIAEKRADITYEILNDKIILTLAPLYSSANRVRLDKQKTFQLDSKTQIYYLCTVETSPQIQSVIELIPKNQYSREKHGIVIATIRVYAQLKAKNYDIRVKGGGIPEDADDDYNMIDIGQVNGRPYRVGFTMIIHLPMYLKDHEDKIMSELSKHAAAGDYPVLIFE